MNTRDYIGNCFSLEGKTAVVIGGTGELCGKMAEGLAGAGADVAIVGRNAEKARARLDAMENFSGQHWFEQFDVSTREHLVRLLESVLRKTEKIDILVNGAGINSPTPFLDIEDEEFDRIMQVNAKSVFLACQVFGRYFKENQIEASIINIGSVSGLIPLSRVFTYSMSKGAVHNLTKNLAREWAPLSIRVNTLVPGFFPAEQNRKVLTEDRVASIMQHTPMNRFGEPHELIGATLLLASSAGSFIAGQEIVVDGGFASMTI